MKRAREKMTRERVGTRAKGGGGKPWGEERRAGHTREKNNINNEGRRQGDEGRKPQGEQREVWGTQGADADTEKRETGEKESER